MPKVICIGRNYAEHAKELGNAVPESPVIFLKPETAILQKNKPFYIPSFSQEIQYECELLIRIDKVGKNIAEKFAHKYYSQIGLGIDFTARDIQLKLKEKGLPWEISKGFDNSAVVGKWIDKTNFEENNLKFKLLINNEVKQAGNTQNMLFNVHQIIAHISQYYTLKIGDIIFTGTPAGVGKVNINDNLIGMLENEEIFNFYCK